MAAALMNGLLVITCSLFGTMMLLSRGVVQAADPDPLQDFCVADLSQSIHMNGYACKDPATLTSADFVSQVLRNAANVSASPLNASGTLAFVQAYPAVNTLGLAMARLDFGPGGVIPPHTHPRGSEMIFVISGSLYAGFVSTNNTLYAQVIQAGDLMIFPRGLIHFQLNVGHGTALAVVALNSQNPGFQIIANSLFGSNIRDEVLEKSLSLTAQEIHRLKAIFA